MKEPSLYRKLDVPVKKPGKLENLFWWSAGIALAVLFLAISFMAYYNYKK